MNKKTLASQMSRERILRVARKSFAQKGYKQTSLEALATELGMTRGVLYHHYKSKKDLFTAVIRVVQEEIGREVVKASETTENLWEQLVLGSSAFVKAAMQADRRQIVLIDSVSLLGWAEWKSLDKVNSEHHLKEQIISLQEAKQIVALNPNYLTSLISGALNEFALYLAENPGKDSDIEKAIRLLLKGFEVA